MKTPALVKVEPRPQEAVQGSPAYDGVRRLLVVRDDRLGDLIVTLPALDRLRAAYPGAEIALLVRPALASLAAAFAPVDRVLVTDGTLAGCIATIRRFSPDAAVCISRGAAAAWALRRAGVRRVAGTGRRWFSPLFDRTVSRSRRATVRHELEHALDLAFRGGAVAGPVRFPLTLPESARRSVAAWCSEHALESSPIVIHPGSGGSCPAWPAERWRDTALRLREAGHPLVLSRGPRDAAALAPFANDGFPEFDGGLPELAALLAGARLVASNSTGPIHLAAALGRPALAIHAPWRSCGAERWGPWGPWGRALVVGRAEGRSRRRRRRFAADLMRELQASEVLAAIDTVLADSRLDPPPSRCTL